MKKIDDILNSLQQQKPVISDPDELTNRIIDSLPDLDCPKAKPAKRVRIYIATVVAIAACIMLLVMLTTNMDTRENEKPIAQNDLVRRERTPSPTGADSKSDGSGLNTDSKADTADFSGELSAKEAKYKANRTDIKLVVRHHQTVRLEDAAATADSLDYYINKIERELALVEDSLYIERIHKLMHADERLQRIVNNYILNELHKDVQSHEAAIMNPVINNDDEE
ncbi:hypothetical protein SAMN04487851_11170 [Prevotella sp. tc2-28]|jgi:hypothetical protein|nr:hypothetical protein SAMN04487851_11170 [Prevotella sp. tc2-28]